MAPSPIFSAAAWRYSSHGQEKEEVVLQIPPPLAGAPPSTFGMEGRSRRAANEGGNGSRRPGRGAWRGLADGGAGAAGGVESLQRGRSSLPRRRPHLVRIQRLGDVTASPRLDPAAPPRDGLNSSRSDGRCHASALPPHPPVAGCLPIRSPAGRLSLLDESTRVALPEEEAAGDGTPGGARGAAGDGVEDSRSARMASPEVGRSWIWREIRELVFFFLLVWFTGALPGIRCLVGFSCAER
ncbi:unnamed protein product [Urochloa humidicola]